MGAHTKSNLFQPTRIGNLQLKHRVVMAPLTRYRASDDHVIGPLAKVHYAQRSSFPGTLLISEATAVNPISAGSENVPGIWTEVQTAHWKEVVDAVHDKGSFIASQLWGLGRKADPKYYDKYGPKDGFVSSSSISLEGEEEKQVPRELSTQEVEDYVQDYIKAAKNAIFGAGFDIVELHGAHGYLPEQFLREFYNKRTDKYGGSTENRNRFILEILEGIAEAIGQNRLGIRISPFYFYNEQDKNSSGEQYSTLVKAIQERLPDLAYIHYVEPRVNGWQTLEAVNPTHSNNFIRDIFKGPVIAAGGYTPEDALAASEKDDVLIAFGRLFISNPDLPQRILNDWPVVKGDRDTYYLRGDFSPRGYTDYPTFEESQDASK